MKKQDSCPKPSMKQGGQIVGQNVTTKSGLPMKKSARPKR